MSTITDAGEDTNLNLVYMKNYDGTDVRDLTETLQKGRQEAKQALVLPSTRTVDISAVQEKLRRQGVRIA